MSRDGHGGEEALSSRKQELRLLAEAIPALVGRAGAGNVDFVAQLQAILNVVPTYTWYAAPSGALTFVNKRTGDYLGLPKDHPLRLGVDIGAQWDDWGPVVASGRPGRSTQILVKLSAHGRGR
jgi:PAS domain-containing protein